jgi:hypothetical protein
MRDDPEMAGLPAANIQPFAISPTRTRFTPVNFKKVSRRAEEPIAKPQK